MTKTLLMYGEGRGGEARFRAVDKRTGEELGVAEIPRAHHDGAHTFLHEGVQHIVTPSAARSIPARWRH